MTRTAAPPPAEALVEALLHVARHHGTPTYAYDLGRIRGQVDKLRSSLPRSVEFLYSLKANPSLGLCGLMAGWGLGADVASAGELLTALKAGFGPERIFVSGPYKSPDVLAHLRNAPGIILSIDSLSELRTLAGGDQPYRVVLRLRPNYTTSAAVDAGAQSRFGIPYEDLPLCRDYVGSGRIKLAGFHVFSGSQVLDAESVVRHLRGATNLSLRAAEVLRVAPEVLNLGGGFGIPYGSEDQELELGPIADELGALVERASPAEVVIELGRYLVAQAGWYLTTVVAEQTSGGRRAAVVDGGIHHRSDLCGLGLHTKSRPPLVLNKKEQPLDVVDVLGCLCLPDDMLVRSGLLPALSPGDVLAFPNAGAYGLSASPTLFLGHPAPAEVAFEGTATELLRERQAPEALLEGQKTLRSIRAHPARPLKADA